MNWEPAFAANRTTLTVKVIYSEFVRMIILNKIIREQCSVLA